MFNNLTKADRNPLTQVREFTMLLSSIKHNPWAFSLCLALTLAVMIMPDFANAAAGDTIANVMCSVVNWFTGKVGKGIATLAIIVIGVGALMGKVSWGMAIIVGIGVAVIFGAGQIVNDLGGKGTC